jgi:hypothetical protein
MAESSSSSGIGFFGLLAIVFITLKLVGVQPIATWSWWWVLSPLWGGFLFGAAIIVLVLLFVAIFGD